MPRLPRSFFIQPSLTVAEQLLGKIIVRKAGNHLIAGKIVETEAYPGPHDRASHAYKGRRTARTEVEWKEGGYVYIYLVYGMYWQLNITTGREGYPECVLVRALEVVSDKEKSDMRHVKNKKDISENISHVTLPMSQKLANGPGKLCNYLRLDKSFYGEDITKSKRLWLEEGVRVPKKSIARGPRINIDYAGKHYAGRHWRFWVKGNSSVSK